MDDLPFGQKHLFDAETSRANGLHNKAVTELVEQYNELCRMECGAGRKAIKWKLYVPEPNLSAILSPDNGQGSDRVSFERRWGIEITRTAMWTRRTRQDCLTVLNATESDERIEELRSTIDPSVMYRIARMYGKQVRKTFSSHVQPSDGASMSEKLRTSMLNYNGPTIISEILNAQSARNTVSRFNNQFDLSISAAFASSTEHGNVLILHKGEKYVPMVIESIKAGIEPNKAMENIKNMFV